MIEIIGYVCIFAGGACLGYWLCKSKKISL